jgi:hypothetical protein
MSDNRKMTVPEMVKDINDVHVKERAIFPDDVASLTPARNYIADKLIKASILNHFDEDLKLFDCYKHEDELKYKEYENFVNIVLNRRYFKVPIVFSAIYLLCKRASLFHLESYSKHLLPILTIFAGSYLYVQFGKSSLIKNLSKDYNKDQVIYITKSELHSTAVKLANSLKFPDNELH